MRYSAFFKSAGLAAVVLVTSAPHRTEVPGWLWNQDRRGAELRAYVNEQMSARIVLRWRRVLGHGSHFSPVISSDGVYVGFEDGTVVKLRTADGVPLWTVRPTRAPFGTSGAAWTFGTPMFVAGAEDGVLYSLNAATGATIWTRPGGAAGTAVSAVSVAGGGRLLYTVTIPASSKLRVLKGADGTVIWEKNVGRSAATPLVNIFMPHNSGPIDAVYQATDQDGSLGPVRVMRLDTGADLADVGPTGSFSATLTNAVMTLQQYTLVGTVHGRIGAYNAEQDLPVWEKSLASTDEVTGIASESAASQRIIVSQLTRITALNGMTGAELWHVEHSGNGPIDPVNQRAPMPAIFGSLVFNIEDIDHIVARDIVKGIEVWNYRLDSPVRSSPALAPGGIVVVVSKKGTVYLFEACR